MYANIVVGTDLSETAGKAVDQAAALAKAFGGKLHIVTGFKSAMASNLPASTLEAMAYGVAAELLHEAESQIGDEVRSTLEGPREAARDRRCAGQTTDALPSLPTHCSRWPRAPTPTSSWSGTAG